MPSNSVICSSTSKVGAILSSVPDIRWNLLDYQPNAWAYNHVHVREERFAAYVTCRQCGKTWAAAMEIDLGMTETTSELFGPPHVGVLSYDYKRAEMSVLRYIAIVKRAFGDDYIKVNMNKHEAFIPTTGAHLTWLSADDPDAGIGFTFSKMIIDEGQRVSDAVIDKLWPALDARMAVVRAFGTPDITPDQTWFRGMYARGADPSDEDYYSFTLSWHENPWMSREAVEHARQTLPTREFRMLYMGEWVDDQGAVFKYLEPALLAQEPVFDAQKRHILAVDLAVRDDFTVVTIGEEATRRVVAQERWNLTEPAITYDRIKTMWLKYGQPNVVGDESGMGDAMLPELRNRGMRVRGIKITAANKMAMVGRLAGALEHGRIRFYPYDVLMSELRAFMYKATPSGKLTAAAPARYHDDCVMSLMLLNEGMRSTQTSQEQYDYTSSGESITNRMHKLFRSRRNA